MRYIEYFTFAILCDVSVFFASCDNEAAKNQDTQEYWSNIAENELRRRQELSSGLSFKKKAKNVILFIGDGMGQAVVSAARIHRGQMEKRDNNQESLFWEQFPFAGLVKTYSLDQHVTDSAASATAMFSRTKANARTLGVDGKVQSKDCAAVNNHKIESIASMAIKQGLSVGFVTTQTVTDATPAALYAHTAWRYVESDFDAQNMSLPDCIDIAKQLVDYYPGNQFKVILGGGRRKLTPNTLRDSEETEKFGERLDGRNLIENWENGGGRRSFVWHRDQLLNVDYNNTEYLLGLFTREKFSYELDSKLKGDTSNPTLSEMTTAAIKILQNNPKGFLLLVEGGIIDTALHSNYAKFAVTEVLAMEKAVETARTMTSKEDTLLVVTADHSHVLTMPGYMRRNMSIFGSQVPERDKVDDLPMAGLVFANGPSALRHTNATNTIQRLNLSIVDTEDAYFQQPAFIPMTKETHSGEDVGIWAEGPFEHLFTGTMENTYIAHAIICAMCLNANTCKFCHVKTRTEEDFVGAMYNWTQKTALIVTTALSIGSFVILLILLVLLCLQCRRRSWEVYGN